MDVDYLIVGAGFAGAVLAERLVSVGKKVLLIDKKNHIGGNSYDYFDTNRVLIHKYGPHYFRSDYPRVIRYLSKFTEWRKHNYKVRASIKNKLYEFPINRNTLNKFFNINLSSEKEVKDFLEKKRIKIDQPKNAEEQVLSVVGKEIYEAFFKNYTIKQWGVHPRDLDSFVTSRIPIRLDTNDNYLREKFQAIPKQGFYYLFNNLLQGVDVRLNTDFFSLKDVSYKRLIFTGPIDVFFDYKYGKLPYRSIKFIKEQYDCEFYQNYGQINYPNEHKFTRVVEIKHVTGQKIGKTTIIKEVPQSGDDPYYPIPNPKNKELYLKYYEESKKLENVFFVGRLAQYEYLNMDQVVKRSLDLFKKLQSNDSC